SPTTESSSHSRSDRGYTGTPPVERPRRNGRAQGPGRLWSRRPSSPPRRGSWAPLLVAPRGRRSEPSLLVGIGILHELDDHSLMVDEGDGNKAVSHVKGLEEQSLAPDRIVDVRNPVGDVRLCAQRSRHRTVGLVPE